MNYRATRARSDFEMTLPRERGARQRSGSTGRANRSGTPRRIVPRPKRILRVEPADEAGSASALASATLRTETLRRRRRRHRVERRANRRDACHAESTAGACRMLALSAAARRRPSRLGQLRCREEVHDRRHRSRDVRWENPHVHLMLDHEGAEWMIVLAPISRMQNRGLAPEMLAPGAAVSVEGYPSTRTANEMRAERITVGATRPSNCASRSIAAMLGQLLTAHRGLGTGAGGPVLTWLYPLANLAHVLGAAFLVGGIAVFDCWCCATRYREAVAAGHAAIPSPPWASCCWPRAGPCSSRPRRPLSPSIRCSS